MKTNLASQLDVNTSLLSQQASLTTKYDDAIAVSQSVQQRQNDLIAEIESLHEAIHQLCPNKALLNIDSIGKTAAPALKSVATPNPTLSSTPPPQLITSRTMTVPTAAALKMGVGFPLNSLRKDDTGRILSTQCASNVEHELLNECGICKKCTEQHLLAKCDTCRLYYHLGCLNPPLSRHPKRSKLYAWQCSECDKSDDSAPENVIIPKGPRRSRIRYSKDGPIYPDPLRDSFGSDQSLAMKSDDSHHRVVNGSESEHLQEPKSNRKTAAEVKLIPDTPVIPISDSFADGLVPTTSTPITTVKSESGEKPPPKKRGRKPKPKPSLSNDSSAATTPAIGSPVQSAPPKDILSPENHVADLNGFNQQDLIISKAENFVPTTFPDLSKIDSEPVKVSPKKGRPPKTKPSITQISNKLQKKQESIENATKDTKVEVSLLDLSRKFDCPLEQFRPYADIPNSIPFDEFPKLADEHEAIPALAGTVVAPTEPVMYVNGAMLNGEGTASSGSTHHKHKKHKSHKRRHSHSPSSGERNSISKKHKKKKKHKTEGMLTAGQAAVGSPRLPEQPSLKLKFCAKFVQAGTDKKIKTWSLPQAGTEPKLESYHGSSYEDLLNTSSQVRDEKLLFWQYFTNFLYFSVRSDAKPNERPHTNS